MKWNSKAFLKIALVNLLIVASLGVLMRYKIAFDFPFLSQKYLLHAHSHFAFSGWITHSIYVLMVGFLADKLQKFHLKQYRLLIIINLVCAYGMLISFFVSGYSFVSITFSTLTIVIGAIIAYYFYMDAKMLRSDHPSISWLKAGLAFNVISSIGTFYLAYMMASHNFNEKLYLAAVYFFLHFQYNGFFTFACIGLLLDRLPNFLPEFKYNKITFPLFFYSCFIAYFLSTLWAELVFPLYVLVVLSAIVQLIGWILFLSGIRKAMRENSALTGFTKWIFLFVGIAFTIKLLLQLGSTHPELSKLAFGFRPVVIAYLHLVLLATISVFLLGYIYSNKLIRADRRTRNAIRVFLIAVFLNEFVLAIQGAASFAYFPIKFINEILFGVALLLFAACAAMFFTQISKRNALID